MQTIFVSILITIFWPSPASVDNMKKNAVYCVELSFIIILVCQKEGFKLL